MTAASPLAPSDTPFFTEADTLAELRVNVREAVLCHFDEGKAPPVIRLHRVMDELIALA